MSVNRNGAHRQLKLSREKLSRSGGNWRFPLNFHPWLRFPNVGNVAILSHEEYGEARPESDIVGGNIVGVEWPIRMKAHANRGSSDFSGRVAHFKRCQIPSFGDIFLGPLF